MRMRMVALAWEGFALLAKAVKLAACCRLQMLKSEQLLGTPRVAYWRAKCSQVFPGSAKYAMPPFLGGTGSCRAGGVGVRPSYALAPRAAVHALWPHLAARGWRAFLPGVPCRQAV